MFLWKRVKEMFNAYIERLAKENEKNLAGGRLDCCKLNKGNVKQKR
ncbi:MAG: hypothetical protein LBQ42_03945 [Synergistaceae bacterium]|jgi:hypothetical protein|nr:hypothetical protein [Synergistaceae bacterium]